MSSNFHDENRLLRHCTYTLKLTEVEWHQFCQMIAVGKVAAGRRTNAITNIKNVSNKFELALFKSWECLSQEATKMLDKVEITFDC